MSRVDLQRVPEYLRQQRWFAGKSTPIKNVALVDHLELAPAGDGAIPVMAVVEVTYEMGAKERYLMPVIPGLDGELREALADEGVARALFELVRHGRTVQSATGALKAFALDPREPLIAGLPSRPAVRILGAEQSNTSLVIEDAVIFKVLRKLEPGTSVELEMGRFLATRTPFRATPTLLGAMELEGAASATVAVLHQYVPNEGDGWSWCLEQLRRDPRGERTGDLLGEVQALGLRLGELHRALASDSTDPAFAPEPILKQDLQRWSSSLIGELGVTLSQATRVFPDAGELREPLLKRAQRLAELSAEEVGQRIRIHGDLHLGQALRSPRGWLIYDFEGEPARSVDQRREKHSPLRDVAGMLRSFDYAAAVAEVPEGLRLARVQALRDAFLRGYRGATEGARFLPDGDESFLAFLDVLILEKTLYEVRYELQSRPDWARIPFGFLRSLGQAAA